MKIYTAMFNYWNKLHYLTENVRIVAEDISLSKAFIFLWLSSKEILKLDYIVGLIKSMK